MVNTDRTRAAIYCRISQDKTGGGLGVERQRRECAQLASQLGWPIVDTYVDNDVSAYSGKLRPAYQRLLTDVTAGRVTAIVTWHLDRLNRSPTELEQLIDLLERYDVQVSMVVAGFVDLTTASERAVARTLGAWARFESEHKSERIRAKHLELAQSGRVHRGGYRAFGYTRDGLETVAEEAAVIREMMRKLLRDGQSLGQIAAWVRSTGLTRTGGNPQWTGSSVSRLLTSTRIAGWRGDPARGRQTLRNYPTFLASGTWPAIVSRSQVEQARDLLADETLRPGSRHRWLLSDLIYCERCGQVLRPRHREGQLTSYSCMQNRGGPARCGNNSIVGRIAETSVVNQVRDAIHGGLIERILEVGDHTDPLREDVGALIALARRHSADYRAGYLDAKTWAGYRATTSRKLGEAETALATAPTRRQLTGLTQTPDSFDRAWTRATLRRQHAILRALTSHIEIQPPGETVRRADADRVNITWRPTQVSWRPVADTIP